MVSTRINKRGGGRPPKFREVRRPVTVTLPERTLKQLESVNADRARAIVKCVEAAVGTELSSRKCVELVEVFPGKALIVVGSQRSLNQIEWLNLVEIAPARFLLILPSGTPIEGLEVALRDLLESIDPGEEHEKDLLQQLYELMVLQRRKKTISKGELVLVDVREPA
ncbi:MAG: hypothetical protein WCI20_00825 [bacterium]